MPASTTPADIKAAALADLLNGDQPSEVAARYKLKRNTVKSWAQRLSVDALDASTATTGASALSAPVVAVEHTIGALLLDLLAAKLRASEAIARAAQDQQWLSGQSAADLAALGEYLDRSAFSLGDRLATAAQQQRADADRPAPGGELP